MPYCSSESKLQGYEDEPEIEIDSEDTTEEMVAFSVTVNRLCAGCGSTSATGSFDLEDTIVHECAKMPEGGSPDFELMSSETSPIDEYETTDRKGKPIKNPRYQKHLIGVEVAYTVKCNHCGQEISGVVSDKMPASAYESESH